MIVTSPLCGPFVDGSLRVPRMRREPTMAELGRTAPQVGHCRDSLRYPQA
jgi:hypothetical protein